MRQISAQLAAHIAEGVTTLCHCWRIRRLDGVVLCFTDHDRDITFEDQQYKAAAGLQAATVESTIGMVTGGSEVSGVLTSNLIMEGDIYAGAYDGARVDIWKVNWAETAQRVLLDCATIGEVRRTADAFTAELRSRAHEFDQESGKRYQTSCSAHLGDAFCGVDTGSAPFSFTGITIDEGDRFEFPIAPGNFSSGYFDGGRVVFIDGALAGLTRPVDYVRMRGSQLTVRVWSALPAPVPAGVQIRLMAGCDKTLKRCRDKFANQQRFRGFPHMPGNDALMRHAGDTNTRMDGGSLFQ